MDKSLQYIQKKVKKSRKKQHQVTTKNHNIIYFVHNKNKTKLIKTILRIAKQNRYNIDEKNVKNTKQKPRKQ